MLQRNNQTVKCYNKAFLGKTVKLPFAGRLNHRSTSSSSKKQLIKCKVDHLAKTFRKAQLPVKTLKHKFDELMNQIFLKIDFDCSGFITYTKISSCKQIPQKIFYFLGGVFQKIRQLGGITMSMFSQLCEEAYLQSKLQDIQFLLSSKHETNKLLLSKYEIKPNESIKVRKNDNMQCQQRKENQQKQFSTKKMEHSCFKYSLKIKTDIDDSLNRNFSSQKKIRLKSLQKINDGNQSLRQNSANDDMSTSFQSGKVRILTQMLDRQIQLNNNRLLANSCSN